MKSYWHDTCRYCKRYQRACGRHTESPEPFRCAARKGTVMEYRLERGTIESARGTFRVEMIISPVGGTAVGYIRESDDGFVFGSHVDAVTCRSTPLDYCSPAHAMGREGMIQDIIGKAAGR